MKLTRKQRRRVLPAVAAIALVALSLAGCSSAKTSSTDASSGDVPTVNIWGWFPNTQTWARAQAALAKQGTKINIVYRTVKSTQYDSVLQTAMNGGAGPDLMEARGGTITQKYAAAKQILPLDGKVKVSYIDPSALSYDQFKGKTYAVTEGLNSIPLYYNKDVLAKYNIPVPKTWNALIEAMKKLKAAGVTPMYTMGLQTWLMGYGIDAVEASFLSSSTAKAIIAKKADLTTPEFVKGLAAYASLAPYLENQWQAIGTAGTEQEEAFAEGKVPFMIDGTWSVKTIAGYNQKVNYGVEPVPAPAGKVSKLEWGPSGGYSMNSAIKDPKVKAAALTVLRFTTTKAFGNFVGANSGEVSLVPGSTLPKSKYPQAVVAKSYFENSPMKPIVGVDSVLDVAPPTSTTDVGIAAAEANVAPLLLEGKLTPSQAAQQLQKDLAWYFKK